MDNAITAYNNKINDPKQWRWEKYHDDFWRALPLTAEAFYGSPIIKLFDILEEKWYATKINNFDIKKYRKACWVIQRIEKGHGIDLHYDDNPLRKLAFVYYLTSDNWNDEKDGGELCVYDKEENFYIPINPQFNTMIAWEMINYHGPLHTVNTVKSDSGSRISLVGFFIG